STPDCSSCEEVDLESESVSEKAVSVKANEYYVGGGDLTHTDERWKKDEILAAKIKKFLSHPVTWQLSADGSKWIGHMILKKTVLEGGDQKRDSIAILGE
ncbi:unnamed protein product, partial [Lymnaea stagnalis]